MCLKLNLLSYEELQQPCHAAPKVTKNATTSALQTYTALLANVSLRLTANAKPTTGNKKHDNDKINRNKPLGVLDICFPEGKRERTSAPPRKSTRTYGRGHLISNTEKTDAGWYLQEYKPGSRHTEVSVERTLSEILGFNSGS